MSLDVYFRDDIAGILESLRVAKGAPQGLPDEMSPSQAACFEGGRVVGFLEALRCVAIAFCIGAGTPLDLSGPLSRL